MLDPTCSVDGCDRPAHCKLLCSLHYGRMRRTGSPGTAAPRKRPSGTPAPDCSVPGCPRPVEAKGLCMLHYIRVRRIGEAGAPQKAIRDAGTGRGPCSVADCAREANAARRMCKLHYGRWRKHGSPGSATPSPLKRKTVGACGVDECGRPLKAVALKLCARHYDRWLSTGSTGGEIRVVGTTEGTCSRDGCGSPIESRGLCGPHYFTERFQANRSRLLELNRRWRTANRDRVNAASRAWRTANLERARGRARAAGQRRRARLRQLPVEPYVLADLLERDGTACVLCDEQLDFTVRYPHPLAVTVEHLVPISWPGSAGDVPSNVALAHWRCNDSRSNRPHPAAARKRAELLNQP